MLAFVHYDMIIIFITNSSFVTKSQNSRMGTWYKVVHQWPHTTNFQKNPLLFPLYWVDTVNSNAYEIIALISLLATFFKILNGTKHI